MKLFRRYFFHVRRAGDLGPMQPLEIIAYDSHDAIDKLPDDVDSWDFAQDANGRYSVPVEPQAAA